MREPVRELAVVCEQDRAGGVGVEPPDGTTRGSFGTRSTTVGRPCGSRAVETTPAGLCNSTSRAAASRPGARRRRRRQSPDEGVDCPGSPLTVTRPALIIVGTAPRRNTRPRELRVETVLPDRADAPHRPQPRAAMTAASDDTQR